MLDRFECLNTYSFSWASFILPLVHVYHTEVKVFTSVKFNADLLNLEPCFTFDRYFSKFLGNLMKVVLSFNLVKIKIVPVYDFSQFSVLLFSLILVSATKDYVIIFELLGK